MSLLKISFKSFKDKPELDKTASFLYGVSALSMMGVTFISPVFPLMFLEIGMTEMDMANMIAWFTFPALIFIPLWGFIADRFQRKIVLAASLLLFGICGTDLFHRPYANNTLVTFCAGNWGQWNYAHDWYHHWRYVFQRNRSRSRVPGIESSFYKHSQIFLSHCRRALGRNSLEFTFLVFLHSHTCRTVYSQIHARSRN